MRGHPYEAPAAHGSQTSSQHQSSSHCYVSDPQLFSNYLRPNTSSSQSHAQQMAPPESITAQMLLKQINSNSQTFESLPTSEAAPDRHTGHGFNEYRGQADAQRTPTGAS